MHRLDSVLSDLSVPLQYIVVFAATALEASALVGLVVPGEAALLLGGFLAWRGQRSLWLVMVAAVAGAAVGDSAGYEIGRQLGRRIRESRGGRLDGSGRWGRA